MSKSREHGFIGPLFIVGMPRSGTKLLRSLLNQHPKIKIAGNETEFLPHIVENWSHFGDLSEYPKFLLFYNKIIKYRYFINREKEHGQLIDKNAWFKSCRAYTPEGVFEALIRNDTACDYDSQVIWGDKSPSYIKHITLLKELFPKARIIHIIRDVRDYCLSINKAWGKNMKRAAQRWVQNIEKARSDSAPLKNDYLEVKYEELLENPKVVLIKICYFLEQNYVDRMIKLKVPAEHVGDAKGKTTIVRENKEKYLYLMKPSVKNRIESIAASVLKASGYPVDYSGRIHRLSSCSMLFYQILDGINLVKAAAAGDDFVREIKSDIRRFIHLTKFHL